MQWWSAATRDLNNYKSISTSDERGSSLVFAADLQQHVLIHEYNWDKFHPR
jgi:hypothetical protein